jgi:hypothetical protein
LRAAPTVTSIAWADPSSAPGTVTTSGTSAISVGPNGGEERMTLPFDRSSIETGVTPSAKNSNPPPGAKNGCTDNVSLTRSAPKLTTPLAEPFGPASDAFEHAVVPLASIVAGVDPRSTASLPRFDAVWRRWKPTYIAVVSIPKNPSQPPE